MFQTQIGASPGQQQKAAGPYTTLQTDRQRVLPAPRGDRLRQSKERRSRSPRNNAEKPLPHLKNIHEWKHARKTMLDDDPQKKTVTRTKQTDS